MDNNKNLTQLIIELQSGNQEVFQKIYELSYRKAYFTALKICKNEHDAEDVVQEAYIKLLNNVKELKKPDAFISWFNMIVANSARNMLRKNNPKLFDSAEDEEFILDSIEDKDEDFHPTEDFEKDELRKEVMGLIDNLSDDKRTAVILYYYDEMTTKQIAESLEVNENTVKSRLVQAKKDLAKGVQELEKKNKKLRGIAPISVVLWAIRSSAKTSAEAFTVSGGATATYTAITATTGVAAGGAVAGGVAAGGAVAGGAAAKVAGLTVAQKIISGILITGVVTGSAIGAKEIREKKKEQENKTALAAVETIEQTKERVDKILNTISSTSKPEPEPEEATDNIIVSESQTAKSNATEQSHSSDVSAEFSSIQTEKSTATPTGKSTAKPTEKPTASSATQPQVATININVLKSGVPMETIAIKRNDGDTLMWKDIEAVVKSKGYDTEYAFYEGAKFPIKVQAGKSYSINVDVE